MGSSDDRDRVTPVEPRKPFRPRLNTERTAVAPPGAGNRQPPRPIPREDSPLSQTLQDGQRPTFRRPSPVPEELPPTSAAEYGRSRAELQDEREARQQAEAEAERLRDELRAVRRKSSPRVESDPPTSLPPSKDSALVVTRREVRIPTWMLGAAISALGLGSWQAWEQIKATPAKLEAAEKRIAALESRVHAAEDALSTQRAEIVQQRAVNKAMKCQLRHVRAGFERSGVTLDALPRGGVEWRSEYLPDSRRVRTAPAWRAVDDCPELLTP